MSTGGWEAVNELALGIHGDSRGSAERSPADRGLLFVDSQQHGVNSPQLQHRPSISSDPVHRIYRNKHSRHKELEAKGRSIK